MSDMAILVILDKKTFDNAVWQSDSGFGNAGYKEWINEAAEALQTIYDMEAVKEKPYEQYILGDVINLLSSISIATASEK